MVIIGPRPDLRARAAWRRRAIRSRIDRTTEELLAAVDVEDFRRSFGPQSEFRDDTAAKKFGNIEVRLRREVERFYVFRFDRMSPGESIVDIGCGAGYFLVVCRAHALDVTGIDIPGLPFFDAAIRYFGVPRILHTVTAPAPLPASVRDVDAVSAFLTKFNEHEGTPWSGRDWDTFLTNLRPHLADDARVFISFNRNHQIDRAYPATVPPAVRAHPEFDSTFFADCADIRVRT